MDPVHAIVLAVVQGLSEFLPISSSGHLILIPHLFGWPDQGLAFDVAVHVGTLLCHFRHRFHDDPLVNAGLQDITAWVDFTAVAEAGERAGLQVAGYTTQAHFLIGNDLARHVGEASRMDLVQRVNLSRQAMLLTLPGEMGERFKVIGLAKGYDAPLRGFAVRDLRHTL